MEMASCFDILYALGSQALQALLYKRCKYSRYTYVLVLELQKCFKNELFMNLIDNRTLFPRLFKEYMFVTIQEHILCPSHRI